MYLNTRPRTRRRRGIALWRVLLWILAPVVIFIGVGVYQNRDLFIPEINRLVGNVMQQAEAVIATSQAPTAEPTVDPGDQLIRAENAWSRGNFQEAVNWYEDVIELVPNDLKAHYFLTLGYLIDGRELEAVQAAENTVTANPFHSDAWAVRTIALNYNGRYGEAIASGLRALELNEANARAHAFLAEAYLDFGLVSRAETEVEQALDLDPDGFEAYYVRARLRAETQGDFEGAKSDLRTAYELSGGMTYIGIYLALEELARQGGDTEAGLNLLNEMNERNPNNPRVLTELGRYYRSQGEADRASTYLTRCVSTVPMAFNCHFWLGRLQYDQEEFTLAADSFEKALELGSTNPQHFYWAALVQIDSLGNCTAGIAYLDEGYALAQVSGRFLEDIEYFQRTNSCAAFSVPDLDGGTAEVAPATSTPTP